MNIDPLKNQRPLTRGARIIIADDSEMNRKLAAVFLTTAGYEFVATSSGRELLDAMRAESYDLVLMDLLMPEMDGAEATAAVRALSGNQGRVPIIAMTAFAAETDRETCLAAGMNDYISKPFPRQELLDTVARWLKKGRSNLGAGLKSSLYI